VSLLGRVDSLLERGADRLETLARDLARENGFKRQLGEELHEDARFLRQLTPRKIVARARGEEAPPTGEAVPPPGAEAEAEERVAAPVLPAPPPVPEPRTRKAGRGAVSPLLVVGAAFVAGIAVAKIIDWRGHAHPRR
jgi:hypothetical protein